MAEYDGLFAEAYDVIQADLSDVPFYAELAREAGSPVLEPGCGTGRLLVPLARAGIEVTGLDSSRDMLSVCRRKLAACGEAVAARAELVLGPMTDFRLGRRFRLVILSCNTINHLLSRGERLRALACCRGHLAEGGLLAMENTVPDLELYAERDGKEQVFEFTDPVSGNTLLDRVTARYDMDRRLERAETTLEEYAGGSLVRSTRAVSVSAFPSPEELPPLLEEAGFRVLHFWKNHAREPFDASARQAILVAAP
jgi:SAM-dependent methyltransferase